MSNCTCLAPGVSGDIWCSGCKEYVDPWADHKRISELEAENERLRELVQHIKSAANLSDSQGLPLLEDLDVAICSAMQFVESPKRAEGE